MSVLFITQRFPPAASAAARRFGHLAESFAQEEAVYVIRYGQAGADHPAVAVTVVVAGADLRKMTGYQGRTVALATKERPLLKWLLKLRQAYPFVYLADDGGLTYRKQAFQAACQLVEEKQVTTVFSSFRPWSDHLVARRLKRRFPHLKWIADFRDLPVDPVRKDVWWPRLQKWWGKRMVATADEIWAVSAGQRIQLNAWHPEIKVQRNALLALPPAASAPVAERFTMVYTGSLYPGLQTIKPLKQALMELLEEGQMLAEELCLYYRGKDAQRFKEWTDGLPQTMLDIQPAIAPAAAQEIQAEAQVLLLLNWSAPGYYGVLTAKLWDYLSTGRPILALINGPGDQELEALISGANAGACFRVKEQGAIKDWLATAYRTWQTNQCLPWEVKIAALTPFHAAASFSKL